MVFTIVFSFEGDLYSSFCDNLKWIAEELDHLKVNDKQDRKRLILLAKDLPLPTRRSDNVRRIK